ncbi:MAG: thiamine phosphate synthase [Planctomycetes bacterium]|nr:thiamine phosphate synthase [Planctomycetota bacterium]
MATLTVITDRKLCTRPLPEAIREALTGGADVVQLREKDLSARALLDLARSLKQIVSGAHAKLIINHAIDVAVAADADGVHLGWRSLSPEDARKALGPGKLIGVSVHSIEEMQKAEYGGADYVHYGPLFETPSKKGRLEPVGREGLRELKRTASIPVTAVGGIDEERAAAVVTAGADGIAVISAVMASPNPQVAVKRLKREMEFGEMKAGHR